MQKSCAFAFPALLRACISCYNCLQLFTPKLTLFGSPFSVLQMRQQQTQVCLFNLLLLILSHLIFTYCHYIRIILPLPSAYWGLVTALSHLIFTVILKGMSNLITQGVKTSNNSNWGNLNSPAEGDKYFCLPLE